MTLVQAGRILALNISEGGVPKMPVERVRITSNGLEGDAHHDRVHHGGPERAVCLYSDEVLDQLRAEGHDVWPGALGENVTIENVPFDALAPGAIVRLGLEVVLQISEPATPCRTIAHYFRDGRYGRVSAKTHPGESRLYARVLVEGVVAVGEEVRIDETPLSLQ